MRILPYFAGLSLANAAFAEEPGSCIDDVSLYMRITTPATDLLQPDHIEIVVGPARQIYGPLVDVTTTTRPFGKDTIPVKYQTREARLEEESTLRIVAHLDETEGVSARETRLHARDIESALGVSEPHGITLFSDTEVQNDFIRHYGNDAAKEYARYVGITLAHEIGHQLGLVDSLKLRLDKGILNIMYFAATSDWVGQRFRLDLGDADKERIRSRTCEGDTK